LATAAGLVLVLVRFSPTGARRPPPARRPEPVTDPPEMGGGQSSRPLGGYQAERAGRHTP